MLWNSLGAQLLALERGKTYSTQNVLDSEALCASNTEISYKINDMEHKDLHYYDDNLQIISLAVQSIYMDLWLDAACASQLGCFQL